MAFSARPNLAPEDFQWKRKPLDHQRERFLKYAKEPSWGHLWEQGCGKTAIAIATACYARQRGEIDAVLIIAPGGVHRNWIEHELPQDCTESDYTSYAYHPQKTKQHRNQNTHPVRRLLKDPFPWLSLTYDSLRSPAILAWAKEFLKARRVMMILDESPRIKNPTAARTVAIIGGAYKRKKNMDPLFKHAKMKRILTGTPMSNGPLDAYTQLFFLDPDFWNRNGFKSFLDFRRHFAILVNMPSQYSRMGYIEVVKGYRRLEDLAKILPQLTDRVTKDECLDLPPKNYVLWRHEMRPEHRKIYDDLRDTMLAELPSGGLVAITEMMVLLLRLQQVACGFLPSSTHKLQVPLPEDFRNMDSAALDGWEALQEPQDEHEARIATSVERAPTTLLPGPLTARLDALEEVIETYSGPSIIWARFRKDIDLITERLTKLNLTWARHDGSCGSDEREAAKTAFRNGEVDYLVANQDTMGEGVTLLRAENLIYYSHPFSLMSRLQSEDRPHRAGQTKTINIIDIVAEDTVDDLRIVPALRNKYEVCRVAVGDNVKEWI